MQAFAACEIKGLFGNAGKPPTNQLARFDGFGSEAENRLGFFYAQIKTAPRSRSPPYLDLILKIKF